MTSLFPVGWEIYSLISSFFSLSFLEIYWARLKSLFTLLRYAVLYFDWSSRFVDRKHGYCMPDALFHWVWWRADGFCLRPPCVSWESMEKRPVFPWGLTGAFAMCYEELTDSAFALHAFLENRWRNAQSFLEVWPGRLRCVITMRYDSAFAL